MAIMGREVNNPDQQEDSRTNEGDSVCLTVTSAAKVAFLDKLVSRVL